MNTTISPTWYQANYQYLMASIDQIGRTLEEYIAKKTNKPIPTESDLIESALITATKNLPAPSALDTLCDIFKLTHFERDILLLCAGVELDPNFEFLLGQANFNPQRNYPTLSLAIAGLNNPSNQVLSRQSPLHYWQLIELTENSAFAKSPMRIDNRILCYLLGEPAPDEKLVGLTEPIEIETITAIPLPPTYQTIVNQISQVWSNTNDQKISPIQLYSDERESKQSIAAAVCQKAGSKLIEINAFILPENPKDLEQLTRHWQRESLLSNTTLFLDTEDIFQGDASKHQAITKFIRNIKSQVIISAQERQPPRKHSPVAIDVPQLSYHEQIAIWQKILGSEAGKIDQHIKKLASYFNLTPSRISAAYITAKSSLNNPEASETETLENALWNACRIQARPHLDDLAQRIVSKAKWSDLILPDKELKILHEIVAQVIRRAKVYSHWGFGGDGERGFGISVLFSGNSGTGKTMAAEAIASVLGLDLYRIDLSCVVSKYIGETEKNLQRIFQAARHGGAILLFDEADALFGKRTEVKDSHDRHANIEVGYLLQLMEAYQGLAILTTNLPQSIDNAFLRRLRYIIKFPFPDPSARVKIWRKVFPAQTPTEGLNFQKLAKLNVSGGSIRNIALNAAFLAADAEEPVMMKHLLEAAKTECIKIERLVTDMEIKGWV